MFDTIEDTRAQILKKQDGRRFWIPGLYMASMGLPVCKLGLYMGSMELPVCKLALYMGSMELPVCKLGLYMGSMELPGGNIELFKILPAYTWALWSFRFGNIELFKLPLLIHGLYGASSMQIRLIHGLYGASRMHIC